MGLRFWLSGLVAAPVFGAGALAIGYELCLLGVTHCLPPGDWQDLAVSAAFLSAYAFVVHIVAGLLLWAVARKGWRRRWLPFLLYPTLVPGIPLLILASITTKGWMSDLRHLGLPFAMAALLMASVISLLEPPAGVQRSKETGL